MRKVLVTGGSGQIGLELGRLAWPDDIAPYFPTRAELDICSARSVAASFSDNGWSAVINCAAYTAVDQAESEVGSAFLANAQGPAWLADACSKADIPIVHVSTDYVFGGSLDRPYLEDDPVAPLGVYGASKLAGELAIRTSQCRSVVLRTAWVLSAHRSNFLKTMLRLADAKPTLCVVADQLGCPTSATDIATTLQAITLRMIDNPASPSGVYHFVNAGEATWHELACRILDLSRVAEGPFAEVEAISTSDYPTPAPRPANSRLATARIAAEFGITPRPWQDAVAQIITELVGPAKEEEGSE